MPPSASQKVAIEQFKTFTNSTEKNAAAYMKRYNYSIDQATEAYFNAMGTTPPPNKADQNLAAIFEKFRAMDTDTGSKDVMSINSISEYLTKLGVNFEAADFFIPMEIVQSQALGEIEKDSFVKGWKDAGTSRQQLDTIEAQKAYISKQKTLMSSDTATFKKIYKHAFIASKDKGQKALPLENAIVYWRILFESPGQPWRTETTNWLELWVEYLEKKWTRSVNKDMWNQTFEFYLKSMQDDALSFWSEDSAWPGVIDEFVAYVKASRNAEKMDTN